jgi:3-oxoacyl-[acyl-carrier protein] reductase
MPAKWKHDTASVGQRFIMDTQMAGKVVVVTGASGGIGAAVARKFAAEGARVVLHYRHGRAQATALQEELGRTETLVVGADLTREAEAKRLFAAAVKRFGRVDTLVANAGSWESRDVPLHRMELRQWRQTLDGVLTTTFLSVREFLRQAERQKRGNAVLISSTAAVFGEAGHADYAAGKAAIAYGLTRSLKNELARVAPHSRDYCGGRINCICPGWTLIPRTAPKLRNAGTVKKVTATMALPQIARPEDIANAAVFLASDVLARHITGQTLVIAGGMEGRVLWQPAEIESEWV